MDEYPKIETLLNRNTETFKINLGDWRLEEFSYLKNNDWIVTEKVDGTNVRVTWDGETVSFQGRTVNAQMPTFLFGMLQETFTPSSMRQVFANTIVTLYGEGYGAKIQKGGGLYIPDGVGFILFDVKIGGWWLKWTDVMDLAGKLSVPHVPYIGEMTLHRVVEIVQSELASRLKEGIAEGVVVRPIVDLTMRNGHRIIGKLKGKDF